MAPKIGKKVLVVGGGNAALDTARSALRLGAEEVSILYRRSRAEMPAEPDWEIDETEREGVKLVFLTAPTLVLGDKNNRVKELECVKMELLDELDKIWEMCYRVLVPGGRLICVVGDILLSSREFKNLDLYRTGSLPSIN